MEAYAANAIPIYYGNPRIDMDCRLPSMVRVRDKDDIERALSEIIRLDTDDAAYLQKAHEYPFVEQDVSVYARRMEKFLYDIFNQPLSVARRRNRAGFQHGIQHHISRLMRLDYHVVKVYSNLRRVFGR